LISENHILLTVPDVEADEVDEETEALLAADYEIGHFIRERIVPRAVLYYTGEACEVGIEARLALGEQLFNRFTRWMNLFGVASP